MDMINGLYAKHYFVHRLEGMAISPDEEFNSPCKLVAQDVFRDGMAILHDYEKGADYDPAVLAFADRIGDLFKDNAYALSFSFDQPPGELVVARNPIDVGNDWALKKGEQLFYSTRGDVKLFSPAEQTLFCNQVLNALKGK